LYGLSSTVYQSYREMRPHCRLRKSGAESLSEPGAKRCAVGQRDNATASR
jgi:hypothetical protein